MRCLSIILFLIALFGIDVAQTAAEARGTTHSMGYQRRLRESRNMLGHPHAHPYFIQHHHHRRSW